MNLFEKIFAQFSGEELGCFLRRGEQNLQYHLLARAVEVNRNDPEVVTRVAEVNNRLISDHDKYNDWRNPEIYPPLMILIDPAKGVNLQASLLRLEIEARLARTEELFMCGDGVYRVGFPHLRIIDVKAGRCRDVGHKVVFRVDGFAPSFLLPYNGLVRDLLDVSLYPPVERYDSRPLRRLCRRGLALLKFYDPALAEDLENAIEWIVLTPDFGHPHRWSYNLRLGYFRSLFLNPYRLNYSSFAESLIHEYYHQRMWLWWAYQPLDGMPEEVTVVSPVTGRERPFPVMVQAFMIYVGLINFYRTIGAGRRKSEPSSTWESSRLAEIIRAVPLLYQALARKVEPGSETRALLDFLAEIGQKEIIGARSA